MGVTSSDKTVNESGALGQVRSLGGLTVPRELRVSRNAHIWAQRMSVGTAEMLNFPGFSYFDCE